MAKPTSQTASAKAGKPNAVATVNDRTPAEIIAIISAQGRIVAQAPERLGSPPMADAPAALYDELRFDRLVPRLRLEQERVGFG